MIAKLLLFLFVGHFVAAQPDWSMDIDTNWDDDQSANGPMALDNKDYSQVPLLSDTEEEFLGSRERLDDERNIIVDQRLDRMRMHPKIPIFIELKLTKSSDNARSEYATQKEEKPKEHHLHIIQKYLMEDNMQLCIVLLMLALGVLIAAIAWQRYADFIKTEVRFTQKIKV